MYGVWRLLHGRWVTTLFAHFPICRTRALDFTGPLPSPCEVPYNLDMSCGSIHLANSDTSKSIFENQTIRQLDVPCLGVRAVQLCKFDRVALGSRSTRGHDTLKFTGQQLLDPSGTWFKSLDNVFDMYVSFDVVPNSTRL